MNNSQFIFNLNDFMMALTASLCFLSACLIASLPDNNKKSKYFLIALFCCLAFGPLDKLVFYGQFIRPWAIENNVNLFFYFITGRWLVLPFLYFYILFYLSGEEKLKPLYLLHFIPLPFLAAYLYFLFYQFPETDKVRLIESYELFFSFNYALLIGFLCIATFTYVTLSFAHIFKHRKILLDNLSNSRNVNITWLSLLMITLTIEGLLLLVGYFGGRTFQHIQLGPLVGTSSIYLNLAFVLILIYTRLRYLPVIQEISTKNSEEEKTLAETHADLDQLQVKQITNFILEKKPYLNPDLTLKQLSEELGMHPRKLSELINRSFKVNFFEFVNSHRIEEAKHMLKNHNKKRITEIYLEVGFSTRTAFNKAFMKFVGVTPTEFRKRNIYAD